MAIQDHFRKGKSLFSTTLVTGIGTGTGDTITLNSATGLPTDTEITLTFNRVDGDGNVNDPSVMERITGTISGSTLTNYTRAIDGSTEQAHLAGTVIEYIWNAADLGDMVDGIREEHNDDGTHKETALDSIIAGSEAGGDLIYHNGTIWTRLAKGTASQYLRMNSGATAPEWNTPTVTPDTISIQFVIDGGGAAITTGIKGDLEVPFNCTITRCTLLADQTGSIVVDIWQDTYAGYPPADANSITASAVPTISSSTKGQDTTLTGWTTSLVGGRTLRFNVDSCTSITRCVVSLVCTRA